VSINTFFYLFNNFLTQATSIYATNQTASLVNQTKRIQTTKHTLPYTLSQASCSLAELVRARLAWEANQTPPTSFQSKIRRLRHSVGNFDGEKSDPKSAMMKAALIPSGDDPSPTTH
jgi:hypothetical protein